MFVAPLGWALLDDDERFLPLTFIPFERAGDGLEPICRLADRADCWERILRCRDFDVVALCLSLLVSDYVLSQHHGDARLSSTRPRPSKEAQAVLRELKGTQTRSSMLSGRSSGRKERVCGHIGVIRRAGISGWTSDPPADSYMDS